MFAENVSPPSGFNLRAVGVTIPTELSQPTIQMGNMKKINHLKYVDFIGENNIIAGVRVSGRDGVG
jgi:hypothetical protein